VTVMPFELGLGRQLCGVESVQRRHPTPLEPTVDEVGVSEKKKRRRRGSRRLEPVAKAVVQV
jgi:hypothetical protein